MMRSWVETVVIVRGGRGEEGSCDGRNDDENVPADYAGDCPKEIGNGRERSE